MKGSKSVLWLGVALVLTALGVGFFQWRTARVASLAVAESERHQAAMRERIAGFEAGLKAETARATEIERDNAQLRRALEKVQADRVAKTATAPVTRESMEERLRQVRIGLKTGDPATLLRELLWLYDEGWPKVAGPATRGSMSATVSALAELGERHPEALVALRERFDRAMKRVLESTDDSDAMRDLSTLARALKQERALVNLYDQLPEGDRRRSSVAIYAFDQFVEARRYADAMSARPYARILSSFEMEVQVTPRNANLRPYAVSSTATNIEVLAGVGDLAHARSLAERLLAFDNTEATRALIQQRAERAGVPDLLAKPAKP